MESPGGLNLIPIYINANIKTVKMPILCVFLWDLKNITADKNRDFNPTSPQVGQTRLYNTLTYIPYIRGTYMVNIYIQL